MDASVQTSSSHASNVSLAASTPLAGLAGPNASMDERSLERHCALAPDAQALLKTCMERLHLSARGHARILKVSRTIADLDEAGEIAPEHIAEAVQFRCVEM